ncbi:hypothetical protein B0H16DRAFT_1422665 [Mycena metata]|uniref:F-box domain-containing protein n=1 Tax=Mycena metata TaxID=1033252 RepID=A0AAD7IIL5_9AGAR|nr:hypothetical protein B0H16DRAFT_1422665 [Mycena metata]
MLHSAPRRTEETSTTPILTLPFEITSNIFIHCITETAEPDISSAPLLLGQICRCLRSVVLSTPQLWSSFCETIHVDKSLDVTPSRYASLSELLQIWLSLSATRPLRLTLRYQGIRIRPTPAPIHFLLLQHAHRWEHLNLYLPHSDLVQLFEIFTGSYPLLRTLVISMPHYGDVTPPLSFAPLRNSLLLKKLDVGLDRLRPSLSGVPWTQLTSFSGELSLADAHEVFRRSPSLRECAIEFPGDVHQPPASHIPLRLPNLRALEITSRSSAEGFSLLAYLTLPGLQQLKYPYVDNHTIQHVLDFLSRSLCPLAHLSTMAMSLDEAHFASMFTALPHLVEINLNVAMDSPMTIVSLLHCKKQHLPRLTAVRLGATGPIDYGILADMLESRTATGVTQLRSFECSFALFPGPYRGASSTGEERLKALADVGMDITLYNRHF